MVDFRQTPRLLPLFLLVAGVGHVSAGEVPFPTEHAVDGAFDGAHSVFAADVDGDGDLDVLGAAFNANDIAWWENTNVDGDGTTWMEHTVDGDFDSAVSVYAADVDGDGDLDVLGAALFAEDIAWWENTNVDGDGTTWMEHTVDGAFDGAHSVFAADVDGDGDLDVLGAALNADDIAWWENTNVDGDGTTWMEHAVDGDFDFALSVFAADVDGDGDLDVLGAAVNADDIAWWENETIHRNAVYPTEHNVDGDFDDARSVFAADVDGDGDLDVLGAAVFARRHRVVGEHGRGRHGLDRAHRRRELQRRSFRLCRRRGRRRRP